MQPTTTANRCPAALQPRRLPDTPSPLGARARLFCLRTIKQVYGIDHRPDWHADLDSLLRPAPANHYAACHAGAFWVLQDPAGAILATAGLLHLGWKPGILAAFPGRYPGGHPVLHPAEHPPVHPPIHPVSVLARVYVRQDRRGHGLGRHLVTLAEHHAAALGHPTLYLHADANTPATLAFWHATGFRAFATTGGTTHFDKPLAPTSP